VEENSWQKEDLLALKDLGPAQYQKPIQKKLKIRSAPKNATLNGIALNLKYWQNLNTDTIAILNIAKSFVRE
jgi:hypothetical protein